MYLSAFGVMSFNPFLGVKRERDDHLDSKIFEAIIQIITVITFLHAMFQVSI
jgi:hypothetical protein